MSIQESKATLPAAAPAIREIVRPAARVTIAAASLSLVLLAALHVVKPEFDPSWRMVSEYAIGPYGWMMGLVFAGLALGYAALFITVYSEIQTLAGRIGLALLLIVAIAMTAAALFPIDPITATGDAATTHGSLHGLASMIGIPGFPIAAALISWSLSRRPGWSRSRGWLLGSAALIWITLMLMLIVMGITLPRSSGFGPTVPIGWPNRLMVVAYGVWLLTVSRIALRQSTSPRR